MVTVTRINPLKPVEEWIRPVLAWLRQNPGWRYTLAGFPSGSEGDKVRAMIEAPDLGDRFRMLGLLKTPEINRLYNNSDLALWFVAGIGIQQSMVTGLPVLLPTLGSVDHLVEDRVNGFYYRDLADLPRCLSEAASLSWDREKLARVNSKLCAKAVMEVILKRVGILP
jgi:glycosyltransferase involved in cell wall biosynthesis